MKLYATITLLGMLLVATQGLPFGWWRSSNARGHAHPLPVMHKHAPPMTHTGPRAPFAPHSPIRHHQPPPHHPPGPPRPHPGPGMHAHGSHGHIGIG